MISKGSAEHRRYWRAWYSLKLAPDQRRLLHAEFGLPESHVSWSEANLETWEARCDERRKIQLISLILEERTRLSPAARANGNREVREKFNLAAGTKLEGLTARQLEYCLGVIRRSVPLPPAKGERS